MQNALSSSVCLGSLLVIVCQSRIGTYAKNKNVLLKLGRDAFNYRTPTFLLN